MGLYAEPQDKRGWITQYGQPYLGVTFEATPKDKLPVAFLDNGLFVALAVAFDKQEFQRLVQGRDDAIWFKVSKEEIRKVVPGGEKLKELR